METYLVSILAAFAGLSIGYAVFGKPLSSHWLDDACISGEVKALLKTIDDHLKQHQYVVIDPLFNAYLCFRIESVLDEMEKR